MTVGVLAVLLKLLGPNSPLSVESLAAHMDGYKLATWQPHADDMPKNVQLCTHDIMLVQVCSGMGACVRCCIC